MLISIILQRFDYILYKDITNLSCIINLINCLSIYKKIEMNKENIYIIKYWGVRLRKVYDLINKRIVKLKIYDYLFYNL